MTNVDELGFKCFMYVRRMLLTLCPISLTFNDARLTGGKLLTRVLCDAAIDRARKDWMLTG